MREENNVKGYLTNGIIVRWTLLTMLGLAAGIVAGVLLDRPIEAIVGMMLSLLSSLSWPVLFWARASGFS